MNAADRKQMAERLKAKGVRQPYVVIDEANRADIRVASALAMLEMETEIPQRNIFGCDAGAPFCHQAVTPEKVRQLLSASVSNGVGWTQITYKPFIQQAQAMGGAHIPRYQMRVGFKVLRELFDQLGSIQQMYVHYNGSGPAAEAYGREAVQLRDKWLKITKE